MKQQVVYIHGGDSFSREADFLNFLQSTEIWDLPNQPPTLSWKKNFATDLGDEFEVFMPVMPNRTNARYQEWKIWFERYFAYLQDGVILVGASLGGMFLAKYLSETVTPIEIKAVFFLAAPGGEFSAPAAQGDCKDFTFDPKRVAQLSVHVPYIAVWHSEDDHIVPVAEALWYQTHLPHARVTIFKDKNHFLVPTLPELIVAIKAL